MTIPPAASEIDAVVAEVVREAHLQASELRPEEREYLKAHALKKPMGVLHIWALGVGVVITGEYFGWNQGLAAGGPMGMLLATGLLAAGPQTNWGQQTNWGEAALGVAGLGLGVALRVATGRSIAARVAANSAAILMLVVLVLSVSLSAVLANTVRDDAGRRLDARAASEADLAQRVEPESAVVVARVTVESPRRSALAAHAARGSSRRTVHRTRSPMRPSRSAILPTAQHGACRDGDAIDSLEPYDVAERATADGSIEAIAGLGVRFDQAVHEVHDPVLLDS